MPPFDRATPPRSMLDRAGLRTGRRTAPAALSSVRVGRALIPAGARERAERDAVRGDRQLELMHRREVELPERAAAREEEAAAQHRWCASQLRYGLERS